MHTTSGTSAQQIDTARKREGFPGAGWRFDTLFALVSALFVGGIYLVGRAITHTTTAPTPGSPPYALLLGGFVLLAALLLLSARRAQRQGSPWRRSLPQGYQLSLAGAVLFLLGLGGTQLWQAIAGSLSGLETLMLPTTLLALLGAILLVSGPLRAARLRFPADALPGWTGLFPALLALAWVFSLCTFLTQFAHPWTQAATVTTTPSLLYSDLYTMRIDGTAQTRLTFQPRLNYFGPSWSPDGRKIAFSLGSGSGLFNLYVMNPDGTDPRPLTHLSLTCYLQHWSPDGSQLVFIAQQGGDVTTAAIYTINADGSHLRRLTHEHAWEYGPTWSPDGKRIAFGSQRGGSWHLYLMDADGSHLHLLTAMSGNKPTWSPDGRTIVFTSDVSGHNDLYVMDADGSHLHLLASYGDHAAWSPDGRHIAFESNRSGNQEIYVMNADGSGITNLTRNPGVDNILPEWSPDSRQITYMTQRQAAPPNTPLAQSLGIASIILQAALLLGFLWLLVRRFRVPFGALTLLLTLNGLLLSLLADQYALLPSALATGLIADLLLRWSAPAREYPVREAFFACAVPMVWSALYFLTLSLTQRVAWSLPLWMGAILLAGVVGWGLSVLLRLSLVRRTRMDDVGNDSSDHTPYSSI